MQPAGRIPVELELPIGEPQERLLDALARLIRLRGFETFIGAPLLLPESRFFPAVHSTLGPVQAAPARTSK